MRLLGGVVAVVSAIALYGCPNPNNIGVQVYGSVAVTVVDANSGNPVAGALVNAGSTITCTTVANGTCTLEQVPVGKWPIVAHAAGLSGSADATVTANQQTSVTVQVQ